VDYKEIDEILMALDDAQLDIVCGFASKLSALSREKITGEVSFNISFYQGGITQNIKVHRSEELPVTKKRRIRSRGI
jgi:hypothetical protein